MQSYEDFQCEMEGLDKDILTKKLYIMVKTLEGALENSRSWKHRYEGVCRELHRLRNAEVGREREGTEQEKQTAELVSVLERLHREKRELQEKNRELEEECGRMQERLKDLEENEGRLMEISLCYRRKADEARGRAKAYRKAFEFAESTKSTLAGTLICQAVQNLMPDGTIEESAH